MKSLFCCLILLTTICYAEPDPSTLGTFGTPRSSHRYTLHVNGVPITVWEFTINVHQMGCSISGSPCSDGPQVSFWIQDGTQAKNCSSWQQTVLLLEKPKPHPYPYLELLVTQANQILTDEGQLVNPEGQVSCNGALDWN